MSSEWPADLDALAAAPAFHRLVFENDTLRLLDTRIGPGQTVPLHTHRWPSVLYVVANAHHVRRDHEGRVLTDTRAGDAVREVGTAVWTAPMAPHTVENVGDSEIHLINIELKS
jgi:quercetin dioxygenase-like cupin family protein